MYAVDVVVSLTLVPVGQVHRIRTAPRSDRGNALSFVFDPIDVSAAHAERCVGIHSRRIDPRIGETTGLNRCDGELSA
jgi:hypothetical protein